MALVCGCAHETENKRGIRVSIIDLIANPDRYHGKLVFLSAFVTLELENMSLCMTREVASSRDCLWLEIDPGPYETEEDLTRYQAAEERWKPYNHKRISIRGTFNKTNAGHFGGSSGAIENVTDIY